MIRCVNYSNHNKVIKRACDEVDQTVTTECRFALIAHAQLVSVMDFE